MGKRRFGTIKKIKRAYGDALEASYTTPIQALESNPQLPKRYSKTLPAAYRSELESWLAQAEKDITLGVWQPPVKLKRKEVNLNAVTFAQVADMYMEQQRKPNGEKFEETTQSHKEGRLRNYLIPAFGDRAISTITAADVQRWYDNFDCDEVTGRNTTARLHCYSLLRSIFKYACTIEVNGAGTPLLARTPCILKISKPKTRHDSPVASVQQIKDIYERMPSHLRIAVIIAGACGLREGEICALTYDDIDFVNNRINVDKSLKSVSHYGQSRRLVVGKPKTPNSIRKVPIPAWTVDYIETHMRQHMSGDANQPLLHTKNGNYVATAQLRASFERALKYVPELEGMHFHDLRHTALTHYGEAGASLAELMEIAGHNDIKTVARYQNISVEQRKRTADNLNQQALSQHQGVKGDAGIDASSEDPLVNVVCALPVDAQVKLLQQLERSKQAQIISALPSDVQAVLLAQLL